MEIDSLRQEIQKRDALLKTQEKYQKKQQAHAERLHAQQMAAIQAMYQAQGMTFVMPKVALALVLPQWRMFAQMRIGSAGVQSLPNSSTILRTTWRSAIWTDIDPPLGDFVNNLFASGGTGHNSNKLGAIK
ncbi:hypothetical protein U9M48_043507 [Paspalum notatum var. saurae]|uniref:Uncharacterized protein n=1 Tax=Paspalum notatum var. saurae TaxID=547442 RepID=A0AAQ3XGK8_PASNO